MADADELKRKRALAKGLFTKAQKSLRRVIEKKSDVEIIDFGTIKAEVRISGPV